MAAHPDNQRGVIKTRTGSLVEAKQLPEPKRNQTLPEDVLHRLVHAQVSAQRQDGQQLGETDAFGRRRGVRHASIIAGTARQRTTPHRGSGVVSDRAGPVPGNS
jgi:ribosomal protein L4